MCVIISYRAGSGNIPHKMWVGIFHVKLLRAIEKDRENESEKELGQVSIEREREREREKEREKNIEL